MRSNKTDAGLTILGGALLGAAALYLLDPERGRQRRQHISERAGGLFTGLGGLAGSAVNRARDMGSAVTDADWCESAADAWENTRDGAAKTAGRWRDHAAEMASGMGATGQRSAEGAAQKLSDHWQGLRDTVGGWSHGLWDRARHWGQRSAGDAQDWANELMERARSSSHDARHRLAKTIDPDHVRGPSHAVGWSTAGLGVFVAGAGLMYYLDPERGSARRECLASHSTTFLRDVGSFFRKTGRDLINHARATAGGGTSEPAAAEEGTSGGAESDQLLQRVRSEISTVLTFPAQVQLMCDADGCVTIYGRVPSGETDRLVSLIRAIPGVREVNNHSESMDAAEINNPLGGWNQTAATS